MRHGVLLSVPVVHHAAVVHQLQLPTHADDGAPRVPGQARVVLLPQVV